MPDTYDRVKLRLQTDCFVTKRFTVRRQRSATKKTKKEKSMSELTPDEQKGLLTLARETLRLYLKNKSTPDLKKGQFKATPLLKQKWGVFVTLHKGKQLRGCIGAIIGQQPLFEGVIDNTINAAVRDPRFLSMTLKEEPEVTIEISALSPLQKIAKAENIIVGNHGVYLIKNGYSAVFLPQVAPEQGWDRETMLEHLCLKAGLDRDAWRKDTEFYVFTTQVFSE
ncbi:AmmeMemoRadiSam system protein A [Planctomycetota bacterium]